VHVFRSERYAAATLLVAAALALVLANLPVGTTVIAARDTSFAVAGVDLTVGHWISDGLLAIFFFLVAIELRHEVTHGELASPAKAMLPAIAAAGGVAVPALLYLVLTAGSGHEGGWPIPTATDIAFALGVLAIFGRGLPSRLRAFLLALAVLDDLAAILIIAVFFAHQPDLVLLAGGAVAVAAFGLLSTVLRERARGAGRVALILLLVGLGVAAWYFVLRSGVHATIAGVALGLVMSPKAAHRTRAALEPYSNGVVLPLFAFSAALVAIPAVDVGELSAPFWAILVALPVGKLLGITLAGGIAVRIARRRGSRVLEGREILVIAALGGIGFTVSLLMNELAFARSAEVADEGTLAVLLGSAVSIAGSAVLVSVASRRARSRRSPAAAPPPTR
jgi:NhaA family Na+:H+ antiporter